MVPYKRAAGDKSGVPVYQPSGTAYQQLLQPFVPVSCEYRPPPPGLAAFTGVPLNKQAIPAPPTPSTFIPQHYAALAALRTPFPPAAAPAPNPAGPPLITDLLAVAVNNNNNINNNNNDEDSQPYKKMKTT